MAKRVIKWVLKEDVLTLTDPVTEIGVVDFDIKKVFEGFTSFTETQKSIIVYGLKQKLADAGASISDGEGKASAATEMWERLVAGKWTGERANATGNAENKKIASRIKEASRVISFEGLMAKKLGTPEQFTEEDQTKLDEFIIRMAKENKKK